MATKAQTETRIAFIGNARDGYSVARYSETRNGFIGKVWRTGKRAWRYAVGTVNPGAFQGTAETRAAAGAALLSHDEYVRSIETRLAETSTPCDGCTAAAESTEDGDPAVCIAHGAPVTKRNPLLSAYRFFREHAGYVVGQNALGALHLARAEAHAAAQGWTCSWDHDPHGNLGDHEYWCPQARWYAHKSGAADRCNHEMFHALLWDGSVTYSDGTARTLASLGSILDPSSDYRRVVEAELALEAMTAETTAPAPAPKGPRGVLVVLALVLALLCGRSAYADDTRDGSETIKAICPTEFAVTSAGRNWVYTCRENGITITAPMSEAHGMTKAQQRRAAIRGAVKGRPYSTWVR